MTHIKTYLVRVTEVNQYLIPVEATSKDEAAEFALFGYKSKDALLDIADYNKYLHETIIGDDTEENPSKKMFSLGVNTVETKDEYNKWLQDNGTPYFVDEEGEYTRPMNDSDKEEDMVWFYDVYVGKKRWQELYSWPENEEEV